MSDQYLNFSKFLNIRNFAENSAINDYASTSGKGFSNGLLRLNRFAAVMDLPHKLKGYYRDGIGRGNNNEMVGEGSGGYGNDFLSWNCFKINCPELRLGIEAKEVDMIPRYYAKNLEYDDLAISYLETSDLKVRHFFFEWMHGLIDVSTFERQYYDDVKSPWCVIYPLNYQGQVERFDIFRDLVPFSVSSVDYDVSDENSQVVLTTVKFKYFRHEILTLPNDPYKESNGEYKGTNNLFTSIKDGNNY